MIAVGGLVVILLLAGLVAGLFFLGGKREAKLKTNAYSAEEHESIAGGTGVDTGSASVKPARAVGGGDE